MAERDDEFRFVAADVLNVMESAGLHVEHLARADGERREGVGVVEHRHERGAPDAVGQLVGVGMPVWRAERARREHEPPDREVAQDRQLVRGHRSQVPELVIVVAWPVEQRGVVRAGR